jgi:hypothetical protein
MRAEGPEVTYDFPTWHRLCRFPILGGPSMCLACTFEPAAAAQPGADSLDDPPGKPLGYS